MTEISSVTASGSRRVLTRKGHKGIFWGDVNVPYLEYRLHECMHFSKLIDRSFSSEWFSDCDPDLERKCNPSIYLAPQ